MKMSEKIKANGRNNFDRGLVAVPNKRCIYLSWRLQADEDNRFGDLVILMFHLIFTVTVKNSYENKILQTILTQTAQKTASIQLYRQMKPKKILLIQ